MGIFTALLLLSGVLFSQENNAIPILTQIRATYRPINYHDFLNYAPAPQPIQPISTPAVLGASTFLQPTPTQVQPAVNVTTVNSPTATKKTVKIAMLGDSMTDTLGPDFPILSQILARYYPKDIQFVFLNYGKGSDTIEGGASRLVADYDYLGKQIPNLISQNPDIIIVESFAYNNFGNTEEGFNRHWLNLGGITSTIKAKLPDSKIIVASTIAPNAVVFGKNISGVEFSAIERLEKTQTIKFYLERAITFAQTNNLALADIYTPSLVGASGDKLYIDAIDGIHPSEAGKELIATILAKTVYDNKLVDIIY